MRFVLPLLLFATLLCAQDDDWVRMWEAAQKGRPAQVASKGRIAPADEPGTPMVVHGRVVKSDGVTPAPDIVVFAYQTDRTGVYNRIGRSGWRLYGWAKSDRDGRFEFATIRPGSYPLSRNPAHIHITIDGPNLPRRWASDEIQFADDPFVTGRGRPVTVRNGVQHVDFTITISEQGKF